MKFSSQAQHALQASKSYAERHRHEFLTAEHLLLFLLSEQKIQSLLESCGSDISMVKDNLYKYIDANIPILIVGDTVESLGFQNVIIAATEHCLSCEKQLIDLEDLLISIYDDDKTYASYYLKTSGVSRLALISGITYQAQNEEDNADEADDDRVPGARPDCVEDFVADVVCTEDVLRAGFEELHLRVVDVRRIDRAVAGNGGLDQRKADDEQ